MIQLNITYTNMILANVILFQRVYW